MTFNELINVIKVIWILLKWILFLLSGFFTNSKCIRRKLARKCTREQADGIIDFMNVLTSSSVNFVCGDIDENSDKCDRMSLPTKPKGVSRPKSFWFPLIDILNSLPEWLTHDAHN